MGRDGIIDVKTQPTLGSPSIRCSLTHKGVLFLSNSSLVLAASQVACAQTWQGRDPSTEGALEACYQPGRPVCLQVHGSRVPAVPAGVWSEGPTVVAAPLVPTPTPKPPARKKPEWPVWKERQELHVPPASR